MSWDQQNNLRTDRANTVQTLNGESVIDGATEKTLRDYRDTENSAMKSVADLGARVEFAEQKTLLSNPEPSGGDAEGTARRILGCDAQAQGIAAAAAGQGIRRDRNCVAGDAG
jgi:hypothetical protein